MEHRDTDSTEGNTEKSKGKENHIGNVVISFSVCISAHSVSLCSFSHSEVPEQLHHIYKDDHEDDISAYHYDTSFVVMVPR
jgi:hypothetical protein